MIIPGSPMSKPTTTNKPQPSSSFGAEPKTGSGPKAWPTNSSTRSRSDQKTNAAADLTAGSTTTTITATTPPSAGHPHHASTTSVATTPSKSVPHISTQSGAVVQGAGVGAQSLRAEHVGMAMTRRWSLSVSVRPFRNN